MGGPGKIVQIDETMLNYKAKSHRGRSPSNKTDSVSSMITNSKNLNVILEEVKKCEILCANCHAKKTAKQFGWYKDLI